MNIKKVNLSVLNRLLLILFIILTIFARDQLHYRNRLYPGIYIKNIHLGGKTIQEAEQILDSLQITFLAPNTKQKSIPLTALGIYPDRHKIIETAYSAGRGSWPISYLERVQIKKEGHLLPFPYTLDEAKLLSALETLPKYFNSAPSDAYFQVTGDSIQVVADKPGYILQTEILANILPGFLDPQLQSFIVTVPIQAVSPKITAHSLSEKKITAQISSFTTQFDPKVENRVHNIQLAAATLNNYILAPGESFSLNHTLGDTTAEKGYKEANIISQGELVPGLGGGVCQISSTLYNAALLANLTILERHNHFFVVPYLPPGRDATISFGALDLKFKNNTENHILISSRVVGDQLTFALFSSPITETVDIITKELEIFPQPTTYKKTKDLEPGIEETIPGAPGYLVEVWRNVFKNNKLIKEEKISTDNYKPYPTVILQGSN